MKISKLNSAGNDGRRCQAPKSPHPNDLCNMLNYITFYLSWSVDGSNQVIVCLCIYFWGLAAKVRICLPFGLFVFF